MQQQRRRREPEKQQTKDEVAEDAGWCGQYHFAASAVVNAN